MHKPALNRLQYISVLKLVAEGKKRFDWLRINVLRILLCWNPSDQVSQWVFFLLPATEMALSSSAQHWTVAAGTVLALSQSLFWWFLSGIKVSSEDFWETFCSFCAFWTVKEWLRKWSLRNFLSSRPWTECRNLHSARFSSNYSRCWLTKSHTYSPLRI